MGGARWDWVPQKEEEQLYFKLGKSLIVEFEGKTYRLPSPALLIFLMKKQIWKAQLIYLGLSRLTVLCFIP